MGGVHAGKYNFDTRISGVTSLNYENSVIFGDLASGGRKRILAPLARKTPHKWASRQIDVEAAMQGVLLLRGSGVGPAEGVSVVIENSERTWEPFYAALEPAAEHGDH